MHIRPTDSSSGWEAMLLTKRPVEILKRSNPPLVRVLQPLSNRGQRFCSFLVEVRPVGVRVISVLGGPAWAPLVLSRQEIISHGRNQPSRVREPSVNPSGTKHSQLRINGS